MGVLEALVTANPNLFPIITGTTAPPSPPPPVPTSTSIGAGGGSAEDQIRADINAQIDQTLAENPNINNLGWFQWFNTLDQDVKPYAAQILNDRFDMNLSEGETALGSSALADVAEVGTQALDVAVETANEVGNDIQEDPLGFALNPGVYVGTDYAVTAAENIGSNLFGGGDSGGGDGGGADTLEEDVLTLEEEQAKAELALGRSLAVDYRSLYQADSRATTRRVNSKRKAPSAASLFGGI